MDFFSTEFSGVADKLDFDALSEAEKASLFQGVLPDPSQQDIYCVLLAITDVPPKSSWDERQKKRKHCNVVDRVFIDLSSTAKEIRIAGLYPTSLTAEGATELDLEAKTGFKILDVANASPRFSADWRIGSASQPGRPNALKPPYPLPHC